MNIKGFFSNNKVQAAILSLVSLATGIAIPTPVIIEILDKVGF